jgi:hypothetical protein
LAEHTVNTSELIHSLLQAKLELQDEQTLEQFWFTNDNHVVATLGTKGGPVCGPVFSYRVAADDAVEILEPDGSVLYRWEQVEARGDTLAVVCRGRPKVFAITRAPERKRFLP